MDPPPEPSSAPSGNRHHTHNLPGTDARRRTFYAEPGTHSWSSDNPPVSVARVRKPALVPLPGARDYSDDDDDDDDNDEVVAPAPKPHHSARDYAKGFEAVFATPADVSEFEKAAAEFHLPFLTANTRYKDACLKRAIIAIAHQLFLSADPQRNEKKAAKYAARVLEAGQALPTEATMKTIIWALARIGDWSLQGAKKNVQAIFRVFYHHRVQTPSDGYREACRNALEHWCKELGVIRTKVRERRTMRLQDHVLMLAATLDPNSKVLTWLARLNLYTLQCLLYEFGSRIGVFCEDGVSKGLGLVCRWGHLDIVYHGRNADGITPDIRGYFRFHYMKGRKHGDNRPTTASARVLHGAHAHLCPLLPIIAMGISHGVWEDHERLKSYMTGECPWPDHPISFVVRDGWKTTAILRATRQLSNPTSFDNPHQPVSLQTPDPQMYRAMIANSATNTLSNLADILCFIGFCPRCYRNGFCERARDKLPHGLLPLSLGQNINSRLPSTTYRGTYAQVDQTAVFHGHMAEDTSAIEYRNSVAYNPDLADPPARALAMERARQCFAQDETLQSLLAHFTAANEAVLERHGKSLDELATEEDDVTELAIDARNELLARYVALTTDCSPELISSEPVDSELMGDMETSLVAACAEHPLAALVLLNDGRDAYQRVFKYFTHMTTLDDQHLNRVCHNCARKGGPNANKDWREHHGHHVWRCLEEEYKDTYVRCQFCGTFVPKDEDGEQLAEHAQDCYVDLVARLNINIEAGRRGFQMLANTLHDGYHHRQVYYCPVCLYSGDQSWHVAMNTFDGEHEVLAHMLAHLKTKQVWNFGGEYHCHMHVCASSENDRTFDLPGMIEHWTNTHGYNLLVRVEGTGPLELAESLALAEELPYACTAKLLYETDMPLIRELVGNDERLRGSRLPPVVLAAVTRRSRANGPHAKAIRSAFELYTDSD